MKCSRWMWNTLAIRRGCGADENGPCGDVKEHTAARKMRCTEILAPDPMTEYVESRFSAL